MARLRVPGKPKIKGVPARKVSVLETKFLLMWENRCCADPITHPLVKEFKFHPTRKWRFDFALPHLKVAFEIEGGIWSGGRHTRGSGFAADCEKYLEAELDLWRVFRLTSDQINHETISRLIEFARAQPIIQ